MSAPLGAPTAPVPPAPSLPQEPTDEASCQRINDVMKAVKTCMLVTHGEHGLHARPMSTAQLDFTAMGEAIYFLTGAGTVKVAEIQADPQVALVFSDDAKGMWASVSAMAMVVDDKAKAKALWSPAHEALHPGGVDSVVVIKAVPSCGTVWGGEPHPGSRLQVLFSALKARVTGKSPTSPARTAQAAKEAKCVVFPAPAPSGAPAAAAPIEQPASEAAGAAKPEQEAAAPMETGGEASPLREAVAADAALEKSGLD